MIPSQLKSSTQIQTVTFGSDWLEISYVDGDRQTDNVREMVTVAVSYENVKNQADGIYDDLLDILVKAQTLRRNPPPTVPGGNR